jgi:hypothetical protein
MANEHRRMHKGRPPRAPENNCTALKLRRYTTVASLWRQDIAAREGEQAVTPDAIRRPSSSGAEDPEISLSAPSVPSAPTAKLSHHNRFVPTERPTVGAGADANADRASVRPTSTVRSNPLEQQAADDADGPDATVPAFLEPKQEEVGSRGWRMRLRALLRSSSSDAWPGASVSARPARGGISCGLLSEPLSFPLRGVDKFHGVCRTRADRRGAAAAVGMARRQLERARGSRQAVATLGAEPAMSERDTAVLIVGAGPTGLVMALVLARIGVGIRIIDRKPGPSRESRARKNLRARPSWASVGAGSRCCSRCPMAERG